MPSVEAWGRCATEKPSLTQMSPSLASAAAKAGSFFSSPLWKRGFSRQRISPGFIASTAACALAPMHPSTKPTGCLMMRATSTATGRSDSFGSGPFGRPRWESRITLPPLSAISAMVGAMRSMRVTSETLPSCIGALRSTRSSTRLPFKSAWSRERNAVIAARMRRSDQLAHRHRGIDHTIGEAPLVVVPRQHRHHRAVHDLGLVHVEDRGPRVVVEVGRDVGLLGIAEDILELLPGCALHRGVDLVLGGRAL